MNRSALFALWILAIYALGTLMSDASNVFIWLVLSFFLFAMLDRASEHLKQKGFKTAWVSLGLVLASTLIIAIIVFAIGEVSSDLVSELQQSKKIFVGYYHSLDHTWHHMTSSLSQSFGGAQQQPTPEDVQKVQVVQNSPLGSEVGTTVMKSVSSALNVIIYTFLTLILSFFFLAERDSIGRAAGRIFRDPARGAHMWLKICAAIRAYFLGNLVLGLVTYPIFVVLFLLFKVPSPLSLAMLAAVFNLIPFLGAILSGLLPALTLLGQGNDFIVSAFALYFICLLLHFTVANFVTPRVLGSKVDLNATTSTIAMIAFGEIWGGFGLILAIPIMACVKIVFEHSGSPLLEWMASLLSEANDRAIEPKVERVAVRESGDRHAPA